MNWAWRMLAMDDTAPRGSSPRGASKALFHPAQRLAQLWAKGSRPELDAFLGSIGELSANDLAEVVQVDQHERWQIGEAPPAECYLERHPGLAVDVEAAVEVIY